MVGFEFLLDSEFLSKQPLSLGAHNFYADSKSSVCETTMGGCDTVGTDANLLCTHFNIVFFIIYFKWGRSSYMIIKIYAH